MTAAVKVKTTTNAAPSISTKRRRDRAAAVNRPCTVGSALDPTNVRDSRMSPRSESQQSIPFPHGPLGGHEEHEKSKHAPVIPQRGGAGADQDFFVRVGDGFGNCSGFVNPPIASAGGTVCEGLERGPTHLRSRDFEVRARNDQFASARSVSPGTIAEA